LRLQEDVVPTLAEETILPRPAIDDVVAADRVEAGRQVEDVPVVAEQAAVVSVAAVDPVVAGAAERALGALRTVNDDVVAWSAEVLHPVVPGEHEVVPLAANQDVAAEPGSGAHGVVAAA